MNLFLNTKDYAVTGEEFQLMHDLELDMLITKPQPLELDRYYSSKNYISHTDSRRNLIEHLYYYIKRYSLIRKVKLISNFTTKDKSLLDVGAGTGDFLTQASKKGWAVNGVEPNNMARERALKKGLHLKEDLKAFGLEKFQVITLWHVLEHLPDLETQLNKIVSMLKDNGTLIIAVPNYKSDDAKYYKNFWAAYDTPRHLWHFSRTSISKLFSKYSMTVIKTRPMIFDAFYVSLLSEKYKNGKSNFLRSFYRGFVSNLKARKTKEYSSLLYVLKKS